MRTIILALGLAACSYEAPESTAQCTEPLVYCEGDPALCPVVGAECRIICPSDRWECRVGVKP
jgi:hypothetical protein